MMDTPTRAGGITEEIRVRGSELVEKVKALIAEGNIRSVIIKHDGKTVAEFPLTIGVIGTLLAPQVAALGALAAVLTECSVEIVHGADGEGDL